MTTYRDHITPRTDSLNDTWHRPLLVLAGLMALSTVGCLVGLIVDSRMMTGQPMWLKPLKFSISIAIYSLTWSWLIPQLPKFQRLAWWCGTVAAFFLVVEMVAIVGQVFRDTTSHFNVSTPFDTAVWSTMGVSIVVVWVATLIISVLLFRHPGTDRARAIAIRTGAIIAVIGMGLAFLMTSPTADQLSNGAPSIIGAHSVGLADGGPAIPFLGWSSVGGDLRIPHFIGMHALQVIPLIAIALELVARRSRPGSPISDAQVRAGLVWTAAAGYLGLVAAVTLQALRGQSLIKPDGLTLATFAILIVGVAAASGVTIRRHQDRPTAAGLAA